MKRFGILFASLFILSLVIGAVGCSSEETRTPTPTPMVTPTPPPTITATPQVELTLSPNPAFVRVGNLINFAITEKDTFSYLSPADYTWGEDSKNQTILFEAPGIVRGLAVGSAKVTITRNDIHGYREYASADIEVLPAKNIPKSDNEEIVAIYFPWFSERFDQPPPRPKNCEDWSIFAPTIKPYDPQSKEVLGQHIRMAKDAGIDAFAVDWFSNRTWSPDYDLIFKPAMENLLSLSSQMDFRIYILYDSPMNLCKWTDQGSLPIETESEVQQAQIAAETDFIYILEQLSAVEDNPAFFLYQGANIGLSLEDWQPVLANVREQYPAARFYIDTSKMEYLTTFDGIFDLAASFDESQMNQYPTNAAGVKCYGDDKRFYAAVAPGYDASLFWNFPDARLIPREDGDYYRYALEKALASHADGILINTWNEWGESTIVEPSKEYGYQYIDITADAAIEFKSQEVATSPLVYQLRIEYSETSDWATLQFLAPERILATRPIAVSGSLQMLDSPQPWGTEGIAYATPEQLVIYRPFQQLETEPVVSMTVDLAIAASDLEQPFYVLSRHGGIGGSGINIYYLNGTVFMLLQEIDHYWLDPDNLGYNDTQFAIDLTELQTVAPTSCQIEQ